MPNATITFKQLALLRHAVATAIELEGRAMLLGTETAFRAAVEAKQRVNEFFDQLEHQVDQP